MRTKDNICLACGDYFVSSSYGSRTCCDPCIEGELDREADSEMEREREGRDYREEMD